MADIFLSYASDDRERVRPLVAALEAEGLSVWWDRELHPGPSFDLEIERQIEAARCVVVVWSEHSVASEWVRSEVDEGDRRGILVPARIDGAMPPLAYRRRQTADLSDWNGGAGPALATLLQGVRAVLEGTPRESRTEPVAHRPTSRPARTGSWQLVAMTLCVAVAAGLGTFFAIDGGSGESAQRLQPPPVRFEWQLPEGWEVAKGSTNSMAFGPEGRYLYVFVSNGNRGRIIVRDMRTGEASFIPGVEGLARGGLVASRQPGSVIYFFRGDSRLRRVGADGRGARVIYDDPTGQLVETNELTMRSDGTLFIASERSGGIFSLSENAATPERVSESDDDTIHLLPRAIENEEAVVFVEVRGILEDSPTTSIRLLDPVKGETTFLVAGDTPTVTTSGHLLYSRAGQVFASRLDLETGTLTGPEASVFTPRTFDWGEASGGNVVDGYDVSVHGTLAYAARPVGESTVGRAELTFIDIETGAVETIPVSTDTAAHPRLSRDDSRMLFNEWRGPGDIELWMHTFARDRATRLTFEDRMNGGGSWSANGDRVYYEGGMPVANEAAQEILSVRVDGTGGIESLHRAGNVGEIATDPLGRFVVFTERGDSDDLYRLDVDAPRSAEPLVATDDDERHPSVSRDGRWLAYSSNEGGRREVYVRPFPDASGGRWQVSIDGGETPLFSRRDDRIYFVESRTSTLMVAEYDGTDGFNAGRPEALTDLSDFELNPGSDYRNYDVDLDGKRVLIPRRMDRDDRIVIVANWFTELEEKVPSTD